LRTVVNPAHCAAGIADRTQQPGRGIVLHLGQPRVLPAPAHQEVDLHVHQAGKQDGVPEVDDLAFVGRADNSAVGFASDADDPVVFDPNDARPDDLAGIDVN
jgi:hypothetical protein